MISLGQLLPLGWWAGTGGIGFPWCGEAAVCGTKTTVRWETWPGIRLRALWSHWPVLGGVSATLRLVGLLLSLSGMEMCGCGSQRSMRPALVCLVLRPLHESRKQHCVGGLGCPL